MKEYLSETICAIFDLIFPPHEEKKSFERVEPKDFYEAGRHWQTEIYPNIRAIFHYKDERVKSVVLALKKEKDKKAARIMAYAFARFVVENGLEDSVIVPMPISRKRRRERGFNQCEIVAKLIPEFAQNIKRVGTKTDTFLSEADGRGQSEFLARNSRATMGKYPLKRMSVAISNVLERPVHTKKFAVRGRSERLEAINAAEHKIFRMRRIPFDKDERMIVVDDVTTTGATMGEALRTLREGGASRAIGLAFAH